MDYIEEEMRAARQRNHAKALEYTKSLKLDLNQPCDTCGIPCNKKQEQAVCNHGRAFKLNGTRYEIDPADSGILSPICEKYGMPHYYGQLCGFHLQESSEAAQ